MERADLEEARAASDEKSLSERADEAVALHLITISELARRARDREELAQMLDGEMSVAPAVIWKLRRGR